MLGLGSTLAFGSGLGRGGFTPPVVSPLLSQQRQLIELAASRVEPLVASQQITVDASATTGATPRSFLDVFGTDVLSYHQADLGVTIGSSFDWQDQGAGNHDYTRATAATGPSLTANDSTLNNLPTLTFNGTDQYCDSNLTHPLPSVTPTWVWMIAKVNTWVANESLISKVTTNRFEIRMRTSSPNLALFGSAIGPLNADMTPGSWKRIEAAFTASTADYLRVGNGAAATGTNTGDVSSATARRLGGNNSLSAYAAYTIYAVGEAKRLPTLGERASLDAWVTQNVKSGLV